MRECPGCGARTPSAARRCRICTRVINHQVREPDRGLAALHPDVGFGPTFSASWDPRAAGTDPEPEPTIEDVQTDLATDEDPRPAAPAVPAPSAARWASVPIELSTPLWEPTRDGLDDASVDLAATIVLDAPLRNGATPPPLVYDAERFDPDALERDLGVWSTPAGDDREGEHDMAV